MTRFFLCIFTLLLSLHAAPWREMKSFTLKKDEIAKVIIKTKTPKEDRILFWRWTLYTDNALVVHESFDRFVGQHILYGGHNDGFRKPLLPPLKSQQDVPYALIVFKKFNDVNQTVQFDFFLIDKDKRVIVDYLTKEENK